MIFDTLRHLGRYATVHPGFPEAFAYLQTAMAQPPAPGRQPVGTKGLVAMLSEYAPKPHEACRHEVHRKYIDIQVVLEGCEAIGCAPMEDATEPTPFDETGDIGFFGSAPEGSVVMRPGVFAIFFPEDAHRPGMVHGTCGKVRKLVLKVPV